MDAASPAPAAVALQGVRGLMDDNMGKGIGRRCVAIDESVAGDLVGVGPLMMGVAQVVGDHTNPIGDGMPPATRLMPIAGLPAASSAVANPRIACRVGITQPH